MKGNLFLLILIFLSSIINAQVNEHHFNYLKTEDGLSSNRINCFFEDSLGFMWIGTNNGLNRFDGNGVHICNSDSIAGSILNQSIRVIEKDYNSPHFWAGTSNGLCYFNLATYKVSLLPENIDTAGVMQSLYIMDLKFDKNGALWIASTNNIYRCDSTLTKLTSNKEEFRRTAHALFSTIEISPNNEIICGGSGGIYRYNTENRTIDFIESTKDIGNVVKLFYDSDGDLWVGTIGQGAYMFKNGDLTSRPEYFSVNNTKLISDLAWDITEYEKGNIILLNKEAGLTIYNKSTGQFKYIAPSVSDQHGLNSKAIISVFKDSKMNLWVGSYSSGVNFIDRQQKKFGHYTINFSENGLFNSNVRSFFEDSEGYIWIGTKEDGGLSRFDPEKQTFKHYPANTADRHALQGDNVTAINEIDSRYLLLGSYMQGLHVFDRKTEKFQQYMPDKQNPNSLLDHYIRDIEKHPNGKLLLATGKGVNLFDFKTETFTPFLPGIPGRCIYVENADSIWLGTLHGLYLLNPDGEVIRTYNNKRNYEKKTYRINVNNIEDIGKDVNGNLWVASGNDGLHKLSEDRTEFTRYKYEGGSPKNKVVGMLFDDHNNIWFSSKEGISKFNEPTNTFHHFNRFDGLQGDQFDLNAALKTSKGYMLFGGRNGFNIFHPDSIRINFNPSEIIISDFKIFDKNVDVGTENSPLSKHISQTKKIVLNHQQSMLTFKYVAINFSSPLKMQYAYMMEGVDKDWRYVGNTREATYTNMREGDYVFKVKATNNDGVWNEEGAELHITILPPWWRKLWFRMFLFVFIIVLISGSYYLRVKQLKHQQQLLKLKVKERTAELANKNELLEKKTHDLNEANTELTRLNATKDKFFSIIAHDLRNPFSSILGLCDVLVTDYRDFDDDQRLDIITGIDKSSKKIFQLLDNLLNWARSQSKTIKINLKEISPYNEIVNIQELVTNLLDKKNLEMVVHIPKDLKINSDPNLFEAIFRNFISNSIKFSSDGKLEIFSEELTDIVKITVKDCGIGMKQETIDKLFNSEFVESTFGTMGEAGTGIGLVICREFIALLGGRLIVNSELGSGSSFIVELPKVINQNPAN